MAYELPHYREAFVDGYIPVPPGDRAALGSAIKAVLDGSTNLNDLAEQRRKVPINTAAGAAKLILERMTEADEATHRKAPD